MDCVESSGKFYHSKCMKVCYLGSQMSEKYIRVPNYLTHFCVMVFYLS